MMAMVFAIIIGIPTGLVAAIRPASIVDFSSMSIAMVGVSMPIFWLALVLTWVFGLELGWFPISGRLSIDFYYEPVTGFVFIDSILAKDWAMLGDALWHIVLPAIALGTIPMAFLARITRASMLEVIKQDYVRTAKAKGVAMWLVYTKHALKNAFIPILTVLGLQFGLLLGGAIITETIFAWPGIGSWLLESVTSRDYPALIGGVLVVAIAFVLVNLVTDLLYRVFDPRMRVA
jgi:peptide/nickel transport system permease protein